MKTLLLFALMTVAGYSHGQKSLKEYKASNGIIYHLKDTVRLGRGTMPNGDFKYISVGGWGAMMGANTTVGKGYSNLNVVIRSIEYWKDRRGSVKVWFNVKAGNITDYTLYIEDAIAVCEVADCKKESEKPALSIADEITKLKGLLDSGAITQDEYDTAKKKLLDGQ